MSARAEAIPDHARGGICSGSAPPQAASASRSTLRALGAFATSGGNGQSAAGGSSPAATGTGAVCVGAEDVDKDDDFPIDLGDDDLDLGLDDEDLKKGGFEDEEGSPDDRFV